MVGVPASDDVARRTLVSVAAASSICFGQPRFLDRQRQPSYDYGHPSGLAPPMNNPPFAVIPVLLARFKFFLLSCRRYCCPWVD